MDYTDRKSRDWQLMTIGIYIMSTLRPGEVLLSLDWTLLKKQTSNFRLKWMVTSFIVPLMSPVRDTAQERFKLHPITLASVYPTKCICYRKTQNYNICYKLSILTCQLVRKIKWQICVKGEWPGHILYLWMTKQNDQLAWRVEVVARNQPVCLNHRYFVGLWLFWYYRASDVFGHVHQINACC